jgi:hypothetical protein
MKKPQESFTSETTIVWVFLGVIILLIVTKLIIFPIIGFLGWFFMQLCQWYSNMSLPERYKFHCKVADNYRKSNHK